MALRRSRRRAWASAWAAAVIAACEAGGGTGPGSITEADFAILDWVLVPSASGAPAVHVTAVDGRAGAGEVSYRVLPGEAGFSDANGDDRLDALVPVQSSDGERQWYLWADVEGGPRQVPLPVAHSRSCGTVTTAVAGVEGGFEIREVRRRIDAFDLPCHAPGLDGR